MKISSKFICIICATFLLAACSSMHKQEEVLEASTASGGLDGFSPPVYARYEDWVRMNNRSAGGRVEMFDFDSPSSGSLAGDRPVQRNHSVERQDSSFSSMSSQPSSLRLPGYPSVEIFPLDGRSGGPFPVAPVVPVEKMRAGPLPSFSPLRTAPLSDESRRESAVRIKAPGQEVGVVYFDHNSSDINSEGFDVIDSVSKNFSVEGWQALNVEGHASVRGNYQDDMQRRIVNLRISMDRAFNVSRMLIKEGVPAEALHVIGRGDTVSPSHLNGRTKDAAARRVEISRVFNR